LIPVEEQAAPYFLRPVGVSDPSEFIAAKSQRIPFKTSLTKPHKWQDTFKNWPLPPIAGWRNWYKRVLDDDSPKTKKLGQPSYFSLLRIVPRRNTQK
jgi:hypothetical protein